MKIKLKKEFENAQIKAGSILFDTYRTLPEHYINYYNNGFKDCFDVELPNIKEEKKIPYKGIIDEK